MATIPSANEIINQQKVFIQRCSPIINEMTRLYGLFSYPRMIIKSNEPIHIEYVWKNQEAKNLYETYEKMIEGIAQDINARLTGETNE